MRFLSLKGPRYSGSKTDHFDGERFHNYVTRPKKFGDFLKWQLDKANNPWPSAIQNKSYPPPPSRVETGPLITWMGHSSFCIQMLGLNILVDPLFSERAGPISWAGPKRIRPVALALESLPPIDIVLIGHDHFDHLDMPTVEKLQELFHPKFFVGLGVGSHLNHIKKISVHEMDWFQTSTHGPLEIHFLPSQHWSKRFLLDVDNTLWGSFLLRPLAGNTSSVYFASDTGLGPHFEMIRNKLDTTPIDIALMPIGAYEPRWFMQFSHLNPHEALVAADILQARFVIPMHYGSFKFSDEKFDDPLREFNINSKNFPKQAPIILDVGESKNFEGL